MFIPQCSENDMLNLAVEQLVQWNIGDELKKIILAALRDEHGGS